MLRRFSFAVTVAVLSLVTLLPSYAGESASIPANADPASIRFEKVKLVSVRPAVAAVACAEPASIEPDGSSPCPEARAEAPMAFYEATYSFNAPPLASDESAGRSFTFSVRFRPEELPADTRRALETGKITRSDAAGYFTLSTARRPAARLAIDEGQSHLCAGSVVDGQWTHSDAACQDRVVLRAANVPSDYLTVTVEPAARRVTSAGLASAR